MRNVSLLALSLLAAGCYTGEEEVFEGSGVEADGKIYGGSPASAVEHQAVVGLHQLARGGRSVYVSPFCSGTLIRDDVVITAAHCMSGVSANKVAVFVGDQASTNPSSDQYIWDHLYTASEVLVHPGYDSRALTDDIAVIRLSSGAATAEGVTPVPELPSTLGFTSADVGATNLNFAGFGVTETGTSGVKLEVDLTLGGLGCSVSGCPSSGDTATQISYDQTTVEGPCSGDSGGPAFVDRGGAAYVAGLTSYGDAGCVIYGVSTRVDAYEAWIADFADPGGTDTGTTDTGTTDTGLGSCGDGVCDVGESCDGRDSTSACSTDCAGKTNGKPTGRYCYVEGTCEGSGCP